MKVLIVKHGAFGDVVRTNYLVTAFCKKFNPILHWFTKDKSIDLITNSKYITNIYTHINQLDNYYDKIFSLDDELSILKSIKDIKYGEIIGAYLDGLGSIKYSRNTSEWFDMGIISKYGLTHANFLKKNNKKTHCEIFKKIFKIDDVVPIFFGDKVAELKWKKKRINDFFYLCINPFAGQRWPSKELNEQEYSKLITLLDNFFTYKLNQKIIFVLLSDKDNMHRCNILKKISDKIEIWNTSNSLIDAAAAVKACDAVITSDSLILHLAISQKITNLSFYSPTSANEINTFGNGYKIKSLDNDYCSYNKNANNKSITAERLFNEFVKNIIKF